MRRVAAFVAVAVMLGGAFWFRSSDDDAAPDAPEAGSAVVCAAALADVCGDVGDVEPAGTTADRLIALLDDEEAPTWIVPAPWARAVIAERQRLGRATRFAVSEPLASTPVRIAMWADRRDELTRRCDPVGWRCLAEQDGTTLGAGDRVRAGMPGVDSAFGLAVAASQSADLLGTADFAANDFDAAFRSAAARLAASDETDPLGTMRSRGPGALTAAGTVSASATNLSSSFGSIVLVPPVVPVRVDLVALVPTGTDLPGAGAIAANALEAGWESPAAPTSPDGLPSGGVLAAIRTVWSELG